MIFRIDPTRDEPLYAQLVAQVHVAVARGEVGAGYRLPSARELATTLDLNMHTVLHAYQVLRDEGVIELRRGRGAIVAANAPRDLAHVQTALAGFIRAARDVGLSVEAATMLLQAEMGR
ncbi:MAG: GntR family transcriptional regulator [Promicromonosporaceae bacterium]|nr:GntR family transcriptional regulator [Promicromonosporaceae bacterium]